MATTEPLADARVEGERTRRTIGEVWRRATTSGRTDPAYLVERGGSWEPVAWEDAARRVDDLAHGLLALGLKRGDTFAILAPTTLEWALLDFALARLGVVVVPIYVTSSDRDVQYILEHSGAVGIAVETAEQRGRIEALRGELPGLRHLFTFAELGGIEDAGHAHAEQHPSAVEEIEGQIGEDDLLMIVYTSGTTGPPKGCMMLHRNYVAVVQALEQIRLNRGGDVCLLFLPLAHTYAQLVLYAGAYIGYTVALCPDMTRIPDALAGTRPSVMPSVPRVYEKTAAGVQAQFDAATGAKRRIVEFALRTGREVSRRRQAGERVSPSLALRHELADRLVFAKVKQRLGGRLRYGISGAAPLSPEIMEYLHTLDVLVLEGYGLTESASGCSVNREDRFRFGTVGPPLPGIEVRIDEDGEILIRGDNVFGGYYRDDEATRAALTEDGWLRTGDVGELEDGFLRITDRKKDIIVTAGGKNVAPQNIENELKTSKYVSQVLAVGDRRPYIVALVTLDEPEVRRWAEGRGAAIPAEGVHASPEVRELVQGLVDELNAGRASYEQVKRFAILPRDFTADAGELTPTLKVRRRQVTENFASEIDALYAG